MNASQNTQEQIEFAVLMAREFPETAGLAHKLVVLMKVCRRYASLMERQCNVGDVSEKQEQRIEQRITDACHEIDQDCEPIFSGDPRGATVKLKVPSGKTNDWGNVGVCVPGS